MDKTQTMHMEMKKIIMDPLTITILQVLLDSITNQIDVIMICGHHQEDIKPVALIMILMLKRVMMVI